MKLKSATDYQNNVPLSILKYYSYRPHYNPRPLRFPRKHRLILVTWRPRYVWSVAPTND